MPAHRNGPVSSNVRRHSQIPVNRRVKAPILESEASMKTIKMYALALVGLAIAGQTLAQSTDWRARLLAGDVVVVNLDGCSGSIGTLKCATKYRLDYSGDPNRICERVTGYHPKGANYTFGGYCNSNPKGYSLSLFGAQFTFTPEGEVYSIGGKAGKPGAKVGTLELP